MMRSRFIQQSQQLQALLTELSQCLASYSAARGPAASHAANSAVNLMCRVTQRRPGPSASEAQPGSESPRMT